MMKDYIALKEKLENLPTKPGVYQFKNDSGEVLYVGKAVNLRNRVRQYFQKSYRPDPRREVMVSKIRDVELIVTDSEVEALILETNLIQKLAPRYNIDLKDDKSFPYIVVTNEPFPRVFATRRLIRDGSKYFGPYTDVKNMHSSLKLIREIYKVRSCNYFIDDEIVRKRSIKICLDYHIKKCEGPCEGFVSREHYNDMINEVVQVLRGKTTSLVKTLAEKMEQAADAMHYEQAAALRDKIRALGVYSDRQKVVDAQLVDRDLFALAAEGDDACGVVFKVRDGKLIGRQHFYMSGVEGKEEPEVVENFIERYYARTEDIPGEIFLPIELDSVETLKQWLSDSKREQVDITVPKIGDKAKLLAMCKSNAQFLLDLLKTQKMKNKDFVPHSVKSLQRDLRLARPPRRIECFDISNIQGTDSVASMVVFVDGRPKKSDYRKFKIQTVEGPNDFASMREVIERRYTRLLEEHLDPPDLIMVDGGKGQLSSAVEVLERLGLWQKMRPGISQQQSSLSSASEANTDVKEHEGETAKAADVQGHPESKKVHIPVIGLAKRLEEVFVPEVSDPQSIPKTSSGLKLLQHIRDEAHRFAVTYHRALRTKRTLQTELDLIQGIGKKRAKQLLEVFGSVQGVKFATTEQLKEVVGDKIAEKIKEYFCEDGLVPSGDQPDAPG
ncbi:MAG: excinuclease ABC subunit C [Ignavibacteriae bacterium]|nr:excinuclease ABC subunit C [Ignavibacteriota bacterium]